MTDLPIPNPKLSDQTLLLWLLAVGGTLVALAFYLGFLLLGQNSAQQSKAEATTVALVATEIAILHPTPTPTPFATVTPSPVPNPSSCAMVRQQMPNAEDGPQIIYLNGQTAVTLYCHDMSGTPRDFLTLPASDDGGNFSLISYPEGAIITRYEKVRLDPNTLIVDPVDVTFAIRPDSLAGYLPVSPEALSSYTITTADFGVATGCNRGEENAPLGRANIDLTGTPFVVSPSLTFSTSGIEVQEASSAASEDGKTVSLAVSGRCGIMRPAGRLQLEYRLP